MGKHKLPSVDQYIRDLQEIEHLRKKLASIRQAARNYLSELDNTFPDQVMKAARKRELYKALEES